MANGNGIIGNSAPNLFKTIRELEGTLEVVSRVVNLSMAQRVSGLEQQCMVLSKMLIGSIQAGVKLIPRELDAQKNLSVEWKITAPDAPIEFTLTELPETAPKAQS